MATLKAEWKKVHQLNTELIESALAYGRFHHKDNLGTMAKQASSKKRFIKAIEAMYVHLTGLNKVVKIEPQPTVTTYKTDSKIVHIINLEK